MIRRGILDEMTSWHISGFTNEYYASLPNTDNQRPKCVVLFSGVPGSGKSGVARAIEEQLGAVRISNDDIRDRVVAADPAIEPKERERIKLQVATQLLRHLETSSNGLIVFDVSCDRPGGYDFYHSWAQRHGYSTVLLRMDIPRDVIEQRIRGRGDVGYRNVNEALAGLDAWWQQWEVFGKACRPDLVITPETSIENVFEVIKQKAPK